jgi:hypothetical protein
MEGADEILIDIEYSAPILKHAAIVGSGKDGDKLFFTKKLISLLNYLIHIIIT